MGRDRSGDLTNWTNGASIVTPNKGVAEKLGADKISLSKFGETDKAAIAKAGERSWAQEALKEQKLSTGMGKILLANNVPEQAVLDTVDKVTELKEKHGENPKVAALEIEVAVEKVLNTHNEGMQNRAKNTKTAQMVAKAETQPPPKRTSGIKMTTP